uniref:TLC domain-containing protein n=1 Tax=Pseudonaja textilis TaxID=8673 RepID=A0A670Z4Q7_PSETE
MAAGAPPPPRELQAAFSGDEQEAAPACCSWIPATSVGEGGTKGRTHKGKSQLSLALFQVIVCFGFAFLVRRFVGFAMVALLVEINSIFLHLRTILRMAGLVNTASFRLASLVNLGTYLVFRILILAWMSRWLALNGENVPAVPYAMGTAGMAVMLPINIVLFYRLLRSDFLPPHK